MSSETVKLEKKLYYRLNRCFMKLVLIVDGQEKAEFELGLGSNLIGRWDPDNKSFPEVDLEDYDSDSLVSRRHAVLIVKDQTATLEDLGSKNGTFLSAGNQLTAGQKIAVEDAAEFFIGNLKMKLVVS